MKKVVIRLLVDSSPESQEARSILDQSGVEYIALPSSGAGLPAAMVGFQVHSGVGAIWKLANSLRTLGNLTK